MKQWIALNKIEFLLTKRQLVYYLLSVGMPTASIYSFQACTRTHPVDQIILCVITSSP